MEKILVVYYSNKGSSRFLAEKIAGELTCDIEEIIPRFNHFFFLVLRCSFGIKNLEHNIEEYNKIILCGPIWMGQVIVPLSNFINKYRRQIKSLYFACSCGGGDEKREEKFGYNGVFNKIAYILADKCKGCEAFPITLFVPEDKLEDQDSIMNTRFTNNNFSNAFQNRLDRFISKIKE